MKILIVGDCNSTYILEQSNWLKKDDNVELVDIFTTTSPNKKLDLSAFNKILNYYSKIDFEILAQFDNLAQNIISNYILIQEFKNIESYYDIIQVHFVDVGLISLVPHFRKIGKKIVLSIWGSDLLRSTIEQDYYRNILYESADVITMTKNEFMINIFSSKYPTINIDKVVDVRYGADIFLVLKGIMESISKLECKKILNIDQNKIIVTIGYNYFAEQRHLEVVDNILRNENIKKHLPGILFVLPLTYGVDKEYFNKVINYFNENNIDFIFFDKYLSKEQVCFIRYVSDIFIHLATTDDFCNSFREYMYAKNIIITGKWFPYDVLKDDGFYFRTVKRVEDIGEELSFVMDNYFAEKEKCEVNNDELLKYSDWSIIIKEWLQIYKNLL